MPALVTGIHDFAFVKHKTWMAGTGPAMTAGDAVVQARQSLKQHAKQKVVRSVRYGFSACSRQF
jgi:hypothetical protein